MALEFVVEKKSATVFARSFQPAYSKSINDAFPFFVTRAL